MLKPMVSYFDLLIRTPLNVCLIDPLIAINTKGLQSHDVGEPAWRSARPSSATPVSSSFPEEDSEDDDETEHGPDGLPAGTSDRSREGTPIQDVLPPDGEYF